MTITKPNLPTKAEVERMSYEDTVLASIAIDVYLLQLAAAYLETNATRHKYAMQEAAVSRYWLVGDPEAKTYLAWQVYTTKRGITCGRVLSKVLPLLPKPPKPVCVEAKPIAVKPIRQTETRVGLLTADYVIESMKRQAAIERDEREIVVES